MAPTIEDLAAGRITSSTRLYCLQCGDEFREVQVGDGTVQGCVRCWRKNKFIGGPPTVAAAVGPLASNGLWESIDMAGEKGDLQRSSSKESIYTIREPSHSRRGSKEPSQLLEPLKPGSKEQPGRRSGRANTLPLPLQLSKEQQGHPSPARQTLKEFLPESRPFLPSPNGSREQTNHLLPPSRSESKTEGRGFLPAAVSASTPDLRPGSRQLGNSRLSSLAGPGGVQVVPVQGQHMRRRRPTRSATIANDGGGAVARAQHRLQLTLPEADDVLPPLSDRHTPVSSPSHATAGLDDRMQSVVRKLSQRRHVSDSMVALASSIDHEKLTKHDAFRKVEGSAYLVCKMDMQRGLRRMGITTPAAELDGLLRAFDIDGNGSVDLDEFIEVVRTWFKMFPHLKPCKQEAEVLEKDTSSQICGFEMGARVRSLVKSNRSEVREEGTVIGHGVNNGSIAVRFDTGQTLSVKPNMIALARLGSAKRQQSLPAFDSKTALA